MTNRAGLFLLFIPFIILAGWGMYYGTFVKQAENDVILPVEGYDPRNFLSGHYIRFQINWSKADCYQLDWKGGCPKEDFQGIDRFYVPENETTRLERDLGKGNAAVVFAYRKGRRPIAKDFLVNGKSVVK